MIFADPILIQLKRVVDHSGILVLLFGIICYLINTNHAKHWMSSKFPLKLGNQKIVPVNCVILLSLGSGLLKRVFRRTVISTIIDEMILMKCFIQSLLHSTLITKFLSGVWCFKDYVEFY